MNISMTLLRRRFLILLQFHCQTHKQWHQWRQRRLAVYLGDRQLLKGCPQSIVKAPLHACLPMLVQ